MTKPISYVPQNNPPVQAYNVNSNPSKKSLPSSANFTPPARNIQSQLGRPPSTHVDDFEKTKISIKPPQMEASETKEKDISMNQPQSEVLVRTPSPTKLKEHHMVIFEIKILKNLTFI